MPLSIKYHNCHFVLEYKKYQQCLYQIVLLLRGQNSEKHKYLWATFELQELQKCEIFGNIFLDSRTKNKQQLFVSKHKKQNVYVFPPFDSSSTHKLIAPLTAKLLGHCPLLIFHCCLYVTSTCKPDMSTTHQYSPFEDIGHHNLIKWPTNVHNCSLLLWKLKWC